MNVLLYKTHFFFTIGFQVTYLLSLQHTLGPLTETSQIVGLIPSKQFSAAKGQSEILTQREFGSGQGKL